MGILGRSPKSASYINNSDKKQGLSLSYGEGDFCPMFMKTRDAVFNFHCDSTIDFEVRSLKEDKCTYNFDIYTK